VDTSTDCHLTYEPLGKSTPLYTLHYVQPRCPPTTYPDENSAFELQRFLLPRCWSKMMIVWYLWLLSPRSWTVPPRLNRHLSSPSSPSGDRFLQPPLFWLMTLLQSLNTSSFCRIVCLGWPILCLPSPPLRPPTQSLLSSSRRCLGIR
jgi:hypothetical protein